MGNFLDNPGSIYTVSGCVAAPLLLFVIYTFIRFERTRCHPAPLMFAKSLADSGFIFSMLLLSEIVEHSSDESHARSSKICARWGHVISFFFMASQFYFVGMCYDLWVTCSYPLRSVAYTARNVHLCAWLIPTCITIVFAAMDTGGYHHIQHGDLCFLGVNDRSTSVVVQEFVMFFVPYILGILSGTFSLIYVCIRLKDGLGAIFEHAHVMVKDHIIFVVLYTILGTAWFFLLVPSLDTDSLAYSVSSIVVGTAAIDCTTWILQKFAHRRKQRRNPLYRASNMGSFLRKHTQLIQIDTDIIKLAELQSNPSLGGTTDQSMSSALRLELIRNMCSGVAQSLHLNGDNNAAQITALHFPPVSAISMKQHSKQMRQCVANESVHAFLMTSHSVNSAAAADSRHSKSNSNSTSTSEQIDFIEYAPHIFRHLRQHCFNSSEQEYEQSVQFAISSNSSMQQLSAKFSEGKSGAFFFMTPNSKFMVKTVLHSEALCFLKILPGYFEHMRKFPQSFIARFYGLYGIKLYGTRLYFTVMRNIFVPHLDPHEKYDIKGSWISRHTRHHIETGKLMKDEDLKKTILLPTDCNVKAWEQMSHDSRFLSTMNIMDYSLLLGIYYVGIDHTDEVALQWNNPHVFAAGHGSYQPPASPPSPSPTQSQSHSIEMQLPIAHNLQSADSAADMSGDELKEEESTTSRMDSGRNLLDVNTMKDFNGMDKKLFSPKHKGEKMEQKLRRRAVTHSGLKKLASFEGAYKARTIEGPGFYAMGIIDVLQEYTVEKKIERVLKVFIQCLDAYGISCIEPTMYRKRFLAKMLQIGIGRGLETEFQSGHNQQ